MKKVTSKLQQTSAKALHAEVIPKFAKVSGQIKSKNHQRNVEISIIKSHLQDHQGKMKVTSEKYTASISGLGSRFVKVISKSVLSSIYDDLHREL